MTLSYLAIAKLVYPGPERLIPALVLQAEPMGFGAHVEGRESEGVSQDLDAGHQDDEQVHPRCPHRFTFVGVRFMCVFCGCAVTEGL